ncbi:MAG: tRNA (adenosine(37)-N6)-dimethylallyltransferase MiaA [Lachnospiraceae bacterium]|nr:tRNA (adenosine(37)-N6)-dimethylallyltransferase MiaA [Lachnospiraceae bacterium]
MKNNSLIVLTGPTAVGKTALSVLLAKKIDGEIISADSMQVYKGMDIGTAKISAEEMQGVRHHLINVLEPAEEFNVVLFQKMAKECVADVLNRGKIPIIAGGTGFYIQALLYDIEFTENDKDDIYRKVLEALAIEKGSEYLHGMLKEVDPDAAAAIHENNQKRIIRALEYYQSNHSMISKHNETERKRTSPYDFHYFVLNDKREKIYANINSRVDKMFDDGLVSEVETLKNNGLKRDMVSMQGLGYKEIFAYLDGEITLDEAIILIKRDTRRFAKRQLTWFRRERDVTWINKQDYQNDNLVEVLYKMAADPF